MTKEELLTRIEKKEKDITKIQKRIDKWSKGLRPEDIAVCMPFTTCVYGSAPRGSSWSDYHGTADYITANTNYRNYIQQNKDSIPTADDWNKGPNIEELRTACIDMGEATNTLAKYKIEVEKIDNFESSEKIKPIWDFLCNWEEKCYEWYLHNAETYFNLKKEFETEFREAESVWLQSNPKPDKDVDYHAYRMWQRQYDYMKEKFTERYYSQIDSFTKNITSIKMRSEGDWMNRKYIPESYTVDTDTLKKVLAKEKVDKYNDLVNRVTAVVGNIVDASDLSIGNQHGEINGIVIGDRSKARVETISAGGWNVQKYHYRILIHEIR